MRNNCLAPLLEGNTHSKYTLSNLAHIVKELSPVTPLVADAFLNKPLNCFSKIP
jgi:hypothetical protein